MQGGHFSRAAEMAWPSLTLAADVSAHQADVLGPCMQRRGGRRQSATCGRQSGTERCETSARRAFCALQQHEYRPSNACMPSILGARRRAAPGACQWGDPLRQPLPAGTSSLWQRGSAAFRPRTVPTHLARLRAGGPLGTRSWESCLQAIAEYSVGARWALAESRGAV